MKVGGLLTAFILENVMSVRIGIVGICLARDGRQDDLRLDGPLEILRGRISILPLESRALTTTVYALLDPSRQPGCR
jgi:hypothetical protein